MNRGGREAARIPRRVDQQETLAIRLRPFLDRPRLIGSDVVDAQSRNTIGTAKLSAHRGGEQRVRTGSDELGYAPLRLPVGLDPETVSGHPFPQRPHLLRRTDPETEMQELGIRRRFGDGV